jgi:hypothetical protein
MKILLPFLLLLISTIDIYAMDQCDEWKADIKNAYLKQLSLSDGKGSFEELQKKYDQTMAKAILLKGLNFIKEEYSLSNLKYQDITSDTTATPQDEIRALDKNLNSLAKIEAIKQVMHKVDTKQLTEDQKKSDSKIQDALYNQIIQADTEIVRGRYKYQGPLPNLNNNNTTKFKKMLLGFYKAYNKTPDKENIHAIVKDHFPSSIEANNSSNIIHQLKVELKKYRTCITEKKVCMEIKKKINSIRKGYLAEIKKHNKDDNSTLSRLYYKYLKQMDDKYIVPQLKKLAAKGVKYHVKNMTYDIAKLKQHTLESNRRKMMEMRKKIKSFCGFQKSGDNKYQCNANLSIPSQIAARDNYNNFVKSNVKGIEDSIRYLQNNTDSAKLKEYKKLLKGIDSSVDSCKSMTCIHDQLSKDKNFAKEIQNQITSVQTELDDLADKLKDIKNSDKFETLEKLKRNLLNRHRQNACSSDEFKLQIKDDPCLSTRKKYLGIPSKEILNPLVDSTGKIVAHFFGMKDDDDLEDLCDEDIVKSVVEHSCKQVVADKKQRKFDSKYTYTYSYDDDTKKWKRKLYKKPSLLKPIALGVTNIFTTTLKTILENQQLGQTTDYNWNMANIINYNQTQNLYYETYSNFQNFGWDVSGVDTFYQNMLQEKGYF